MKKGTYLLIAILLLVSCVIEENITDEIEEIETQLDYPTSQVNFPSQGLLGEYLIVTATNLQANKLRFKFNDITADAFQYSVDTVKVEVPRSLNEVNSVVSITVSATDSLIHNSNFQLKAPLITGVERTLVEFNESIWIYGENFDLDYSSMEVKVNGNYVGINETTRDSLQINIPSNLDTSILDVTVSAQLQDTNADQLMTLKTPELTGSDQTVNVGGIMEITGINFNPNSENGLFVINDEIEAFTVSITGTHLARVRVPFGPYADFEINKISYETVGLQTEINTNILIDSDYILYTKNNISPSTNIRHYNDKSYAFVNDSDVGSVPEFYLYELDYSTRTWNKIESFSVSGYDLRDTMDDNGNMYLFVSQNGDMENMIYKINLNTFSFESIAMPANNPLRIAPALFCIDNTLYYGKGKVGVGAFDGFHTDLYAYDLTDGIWTELSTDNSQFNSSNDYDYQNNKYVQTYTIQTFVEYELKYFDPTTNSFTAVVPSSTFETANVFNYLNKLLRVTLIGSTQKSYFYEYNNQNLLTTLNTQQLQGTSRYFAKDDKVFFYSSISNNVYSPSEGFYLMNPSISSQL